MSLKFNIACLTTYSGKGMGKQSEYTKLPAETSTPFGDDLKTENQLIIVSFPILAKLKKRAKAREQGLI